MEIKISLKKRMFIYFILIISSLVGLFWYNEYILLVISWIKKQTEVGDDRYFLVLAKQALTEAINHYKTAHKFHTEAKNLLIDANTKFNKFTNLIH